MAENRRIKRFEELEFKDDFMFGVIMRDERYCKPFLERVLGLKISRIEYPTSQKSINLSADAKSVRLDVYVEDDQETVYNIEMQTAMRKEIPKRMRYYQGMIDLNILEKGEHYSKLKRSIVIFVCTFDLFGKGRHIYTFENRCKEDPELQLGDDTVRIVLNTKGTMDDVSPELKRLLSFIDGGEPEDEYTKVLESAVQSTRNNEKWRLDYMTLEMSYKEKYDQGLEDGIEQGIGQGIRKMVVGLLEDGELSLTKIAQMSGLSIDQVKELKEKLEDK